MATGSMLLTELTTDVFFIFNTPHLYVLIKLETSWRLQVREHVQKYADSCNVKKMLLCGFSLSFSSVEGGFCLCSAQCPRPFWTICQRQQPCFIKMSVHCSQPASGKSRKPLFFCCLAGQSVPAAPSDPEEEENKRGEKKISFRFSANLIKRLKSYKPEKWNWKKNQENVHKKLVNYCTIICKIYQKYNIHVQYVQFKYKNYKIQSPHSCVKYDNIF